MTSPRSGCPSKWSWSCRCSSGVSKSSICSENTGDSMKWRSTCRCYSNGVVRQPENLCFTHGFVSEGRKVGRSEGRKVGRSEGDSLQALFLPSLLELSQPEGVFITRRRHPEGLDYGRRVSSMMTTGGLSIRHLRVSRSLKSKVAETGRPQRLFLFSTTFRPSDAAGSSNVEGKWETGLLSWGRGVG